MKKIFVALSLLLSTLLLVFMVGCGSDDSGDANSPNDGTTVDTPSTDDTDGNEQQPALLEFEGISFVSKTVMYNGKEQSITISGELPDGTTVVYSNNTATEVGVYEATATLTNPNYETKVLHATLTVKSIAASAVNVINTVLQRPDAWSFIPETFGRENMAYSEADFPASDFTSGTNVSEISPRFVGAQLMVMYDGLLNMESILSKADVVFALGEAIAAAYQEFINDNPEEYTEFYTEIKGFKIFVSLEGAQSKLLAGNSTVSVELYADSDNNVNSGRISITDGASLKYEMNDTSLTFAYQIGVADAAKTSIISFARENDKVAGYIYEFLGYNGTGLTTTAVISLDDEYTRIVAKKRESDDLLILGYEEVYDSQTAEYISGRVSETVKLVDFETYWFNLSDISGINSIRVEDEANGMNADSIYVNGTSSLFVTEKIGGWGLDTLSRRYDIEMKTVYYYKAVTVEDEIEYEKVEVEIPMLFVQTKSFEDFSTDVYENNASAFSAKPQIKQGIADVADAEYEILMQTFDQIQLFEYTDVIMYIGSPDSFFEDQQ
ncbi:MAG: hypothetical protein IJ515_05140 [Clostridia bacterium]|nr:hypothetical protein [Clostridia bacterium]